MKKQIISEYFRVYRLDNLIHKIKDWLSGVVLEIIILFELCAGDEPEDIFAACCIYIPLFLILSAAFLHPARPEKLFYLCPMDERERKQFIRGTFVFSQLMNGMCVLLGCLLAATRGYTGAGLFMMLFVNGIVASLCVYPVEKRSERDWEAEKQKMLGWFGFFVVCFSDFMILLGLAGLVVETKRMLLIVSVLVAVFCELPVLISKCRFLKGQFQRMECYETVVFSGKQP